MGEVTHARSFVSPPTPGFILGLVVSFSFCIQDCKRRIYYEPEDDAPPPRAFVASTPYTTPSSGFEMQQPQPMQPVAQPYGGGQPYPQYPAGGAMPMAYPTQG